jgi:polar amino acid transport system substrate-binding protein
MPERVHARLLLIVIAMAAAFWLGLAQSALAQNAAPANPDTSASEDTAESMPRRVVIRFLTDSDFPPFDFYDEEGVLVGFNVDLARAICLELNTSCDIKARPWNELFPDLKRGEADAVIAAHKVTADALKQVAFTERYFHTPGRFVGRKNSPKVDMTPSGLDGMRIAVARGSAHEAFLKAFFRDSPLTVYDNADLARQALEKGKVDFLFGDGISLAFWLNGTLSRQCCEMRGGPFLEPKYFGDGIAIAVPKNDPDIRHLLNKGLDRVRASGRFQELVQRYFPVRIY